MGCLAVQRWCRVRAQTSLAPSPSSVESRLAVAAAFPQEQARTCVRGTRAVRHSHLGSESGCEHGNAPTEPH
jgi:hypothetical protein